MPNRPSERTRGSREPHARPRAAGVGQAPAPVGQASVSPGARATTAALLARIRGRAGAGVAVIVVAALALALAGFFGEPGRNPDSVVAAGASGRITVPPSATGGDGQPPGASGAPSPRPSAAIPSPTIAPFPVNPDPLVGVPVARLQKALDAFRAKTGIPGISVAIAWDDGRAWAGAAGYADVASETPLTTGTAFAFASVSKTLTAAVVQQLVAEGRVQLDGPAATYLPEFGLDERITVRMLLDHRSSLPDFFANAKIDEALQADKEATWTPLRTWQFVPGRRVPGTVYDYSNTNYLLLGELVRHVTGRPLAVEVRERLLDPLGLATAWYQGAEEPRAPRTTAYRLYRSGSRSSVTAVSGAGPEMPFRSVVTAAGGAGSIAGTAMDAARWMQAYGSGRIQGPRMYREMIDDAKYTRAMRAIVTYGLGVQLITIQGQPTLGHSGRYLGYQNTVRYLTKPGISIAILTNQNTWDPAILMRTLVRIVAPVASPGPSGAPPSPGG